MRHANLLTKHRSVLTHSYMQAQRHIYTNTHTGWHSVSGLTNSYYPTSLYLPTDVPCVSPRLLSIPAFSSPSLIQACPAVTSSPITACRHKSQQQKDWKERMRRLKERQKQKIFTRGEALVRVPLFFSSTKDQWASISGLSVDTGPQNEQPAGWINTDET